MQALFKTPITVLCISALLMVSCEKESPEIANASDNASEKISFQGRVAHVKNGRLIFPSVEAAVFFQNALKKESPELQASLASLKGFTSSWEAFERFTDECTEAGKLLDLTAHQAYAHLIRDKKGEVYLEPVVDDPALRYLTNADGVFQIDERVYKVAFEAASVLDAQQYDTHGFSAAMAVEQIPIIRHKVRSYEKVNIDACDGRYDNNKRKVNGELEERSDLFSSNVNCIVRTKHHVRVGFVWFRQNVDFLAQSGGISVNYNPNYWVVDASNSNPTSEISKTFFSGPNAFIYQGSARHWAYNNNNPQNVGECYTYAPY